MNFLLLPLAYHSLGPQHSSFIALYFDIDDRLKLVDGNKCGFLLNIAYVHTWSTVKIVCV